MNDFDDKIKMLLSNVGIFYFTLTTYLKYYKWNYTMVDKTSNLLRWL